MRPDKTLVQLVTWINTIEDENAKLIVLARKLQEDNKELQAKVDKPPKKKKDEPEED